MIRFVALCVGSIVVISWLSEGGGRFVESFEFFSHFLEIRFTGHLIALLRHGTHSYDRQFCSIGGLIVNGCQNRGNADRKIRCD
jgi:hypothetical protein